MAMYNRRWLEEPEMTDSEVRRWVTGPRLSQGDRVIIENRSLEERANSMEKSSSGSDGVARVNADKIVRELRNRAAMQSSELNKQKSERVRQLAVEKGIPGASSQGPLGNILGYAGLPEVRPRIAGRKKTHKSKKSKRKTRKNRK